MSAPEPDRRRRASRSIALVFITSIAAPGCFQKEQPHPTASGAYPYAPGPGGQQVASDAVIEIPAVGPDGQPLPPEEQPPFMEGQPGTPTPVAGTTNHTASTTSHGSGSHVVHHHHYGSHGGGNYMLPYLLGRMSGSSYGSSPMGGGMFPPTHTSGFSNGTRPYNGSSSSSYAGSRSSPSPLTPHTSSGFSSPSRSSSPSTSHSTSTGTSSRGGFGSSSASHSSIGS